MWVFGIDRIGSVARLLGRLACDRWWHLPYWSVRRCARAEDTSAPAMLQVFEASWSTIENRMPDIFQTGYGQMWLPPPQRADTETFPSDTTCSIDSI